MYFKNLRRSNKLHNHILFLIRGLEVIAAGIVTMTTSNINKVCAFSIFHVLDENFLLPEFTNLEHYLVRIRSTGAMTIADMSPATIDATKWHEMPSCMIPALRSACFA